MRDTTAATETADESTYHFRCPDCGFSDKEAGVLATKEQRYCGLCAGDTGRDVLLIRWRATESEVK